MGQFDVGIGALRGDVKIWDQQSGQMAQIVEKVNGLRMDRLEAGIFQIFVSAYQEAVNQVAGRAGEGKTALAAVATTLTTVANAYQQDEADNTHRFKDLH
jgi:uncharacterized protein YukE